MSALTRSLVYPESPRWFRDRIWLSDVHDRRLKAVDATGRVEAVAVLPARPAGLGVLPDDTLLVATALDARLHVLDDGLPVPVADLSPLVHGLLNDMVVDPKGRVWVGDTGFRPAEGEPPAPGRIVLYGPGGVLGVAAEDLEFPNGMAITDDLRMLYVAETFGRRITAFTVESDGALTNRRTVAELDAPPDGLCLDADGCLWVAATQSRTFLRIDPGGSVLAELPSPGRLAVACVFVGADRGHLALCSADTTYPRLAQGISNGRLDLVDVDVTGAGTP